MDCLDLAVFDPPPPPPSPDLPPEYTGDTRGGVTPSFQILYIKLATTVEFIKIFFTTVAKLLVVSP